MKTPKVVRCSTDEREAITANQLAANWKPLFEKSMAADGWFIFMDDSWQRDEIWAFLQGYRSNVTSQKPGYADDVGFENSRNKP